MMNTIRNRFHWTSGLLVAIVFTSLAACAAFEGSPIKRTFDVGYGGTLTIDTDRGSIEILTSEAKTVDVEVTREVRYGLGQDAEEVLEDFVIDFSHRGKDVTIEGKFQHSWDWDRWQNNLRIHYKVTVPEKYNLDLVTSGGSISVDDLEGEVRSKTSGGSLSFEQITGPIYARTSGGPISLESSEGDVDLGTSGGGLSIGRVRGTVRAQTSGGSIKVEEAEGEVNVSTSGGSIHVGEVQGRIEAKTSGGPINASITQQPQGDCVLKTSGGGITVYLAENIQVNVDAHTSGGNVRSDLPITVQGEIGRGDLEGTINGGGPMLYLHTSGGSIKILKQ